jgi:PAS domain S-box-containing protein
MPGWTWLAPVVAVGLFVAVMIGMFLYLREQESRQQKEALYKDIDLAQQSIKLRLTALQESMLTLSRDIASGEVSEESVWGDTAPILKDYPFVVALAWLESERKARWVRPAPSTLSEVLDVASRRINDLETTFTFQTVAESGRPAYSRAFLAPDGQMYMELQVPVGLPRKAQGTLLALMSVDRMLVHLVPGQLTQKYRVMFVDDGDNAMASSSARAPQDDELTYITPIDPPGRGMSMRAYAYKAESRLVENMVMVIMVGLSGLIVWSLWTLWRHTRRRGAAERALLTETNFRRAMENSVITGMRAFDLSGRITYVNRAFCEMLGLTEAELLGKSAPYPYWPRERFVEQQKSLDLVLSGRSPPSGLQVEVQRADGSVFQARMYVSPLIDEHGVQTGWMTSVTDITEPNRIRDELAAAQKRFLAVFEQLDSAVSVRAPEAGTDQLLFANRTYTELFGYSPRGHLQLSPGVQSEEMHAYEMFYEPARAWFEVRERDIDWVDGRTVRLQVATDVTARHEAEEMTRAQLEKVQLTSRLITMGEMASSLAHELNQPLTAIANYSNGVMARMKAGQTEPDVLLPALQKTTEQAHRAGAIIRRIRNFVKRSEPIRGQADLRSIVDDAVGFAEIEAKRNGVRIESRVPRASRRLFVDGIMIEQVLLNLLKNAIDAMRNSALPPEARLVRLVVRERNEEIEFAVIDRGNGVAPGTHAKLFEPFYSTKSDGMGMGLNICRTIIEFHQGRLWVEDNPDGGAIFRFTLPHAAIETIE